MYNTIMKNNFDYTPIIKELSEINPLEDKAFQILLSDYKIFSLIIKAITGDELSENHIYHFNQTILINVDNKEVRLDSIRRYIEGIYNIEGQNDARHFPFKRHLFYWSIICSNSLKTGQSYKELPKITSIVIYKDKGNKPLKQYAQLEGNIFDEESEKSLLTLISINSKRWKEAESPLLKEILAIIHNGVYTEETSHLFDGIDINSETFKSFNRAVRMSCARLRFEEYKKEGVNSMVQLYENFLSAEELLEAELKGEIKGILKGKMEGKIEGEIEGIIKGKIEILFNDLGYTVSQIAERLGLDENRVTEVIKSLGN